MARKAAATTKKATETKAAATKKAVAEKAVELEKDVEKVAAETTASSSISQQSLTRLLLLTRQ